MAKARKVAAKDPPSVDIDVESLGVDPGKTVEDAVRYKYKIDGVLRLRFLYSKADCDRYRANWYKDDVLIKSLFLHVEPGHITDRTVDAKNKNI